MGDNEILEQLNSIFRDVFDEEDITLSLESTADDVDDWDSLNHMNLILRVESEFSVKFSNKQVAELTNVGDLVNLIASKKSC